MMPSTANQLNVAIACGGTGGHLFPGLAVAGQLVQRGVRVTLMVSPKEIDQLALKSAADMEFVTLPAVGLTRGRVLAFLQGFLQSYRAARKYFKQLQPQAALAMGGFTSAPPILAAKRLQAATFLHESNTIPGRANRWLSWIVDRAFVGFPSAAARLHSRHTVVTGTPVRPRFQRLDRAACRTALGLDPARPVALVMGGSQGANGINELVIRSLPWLASLGPDWQWFHLSGATGLDQLKQAYAARNLVATVHPFFLPMELAMGAATAAISRAGASSLAELAATRLPAVLIPFPSATDDHQFYNAQAFVETGAARLLDQKTARPEELAGAFGELMCQEMARQKIQAALARWHTPQAAEQIAQAMIEAAGVGARPVGALTRSNRGNAPTDLTSFCRAEFELAGPGSSFHQADHPAFSERSVR
jgi:UDP-N-acetylglucosamine--N-acetylmuramyl-(pentapeptide) pyrophosphoryl-undecaprenol N-acetylglucosamine transferase